SAITGGDPLMSPELSNRVGAWEEHIIEDRGNHLGRQVQFFLSGNKLLLLPLLCQQTSDSSFFSFKLESHQ
ncbi:hypothetical protein ACQP3D_28600, partial [Escherichia coli]